MKRIITCLLCFALLTSLCGCFADFDLASLGNTTTSNSTGTVESTPDVTTPETTTPEVTTTPQNPSDSASSNKPIIKDETYVVNAYMEYLTFEDACKLATDVVVATFLGNRHYGSNTTEYSFAVKKRLLGDAPDQINAYVTGVTVFVDNVAVGTYNQQEVYMYHGVDYLLVLDHRTSIYNNTDIYQFICNIAIDASNIEESKMYNQSIYPHSTKFDFSKADFQTALAYIQELVKDNTPSIQVDKTPPVSEIMNNSTDVLVVKIDKCDQKVINDFRDTGFYTCTVTETLMGSIQSGKTVQILFRNEDVSVGDEIVVALNNYDGAPYYCLTSLNSIFEMDQKDELASLLTNP